MIFTNIESNIKVEILATTTASITTLNNDDKAVIGINRWLKSRDRNAPLEGGNAVQYSHNISADGKSILILGDLIDFARGLWELNLVPENLRDDLIEEVVSRTVVEAVQNISSPRISKLAAEVGKKFEADRQRHPDIVSVGFKR